MLREVAAACPGFWICPVSVRLLALETSGTAGSVAAWEGDRLAAEISLPPAEKSARTLAPAMQQILRQAGWRPAEVQVVSVVVGPGSFTGLRVGVTTAKTFAYAVGADVIGVGTLDVIAHQSPPTAADLWVVIDAHRSEVFTGHYRCVENAWQPAAPPTIAGIDGWLAGLAPGTLVSGPGLVKLAARLPNSVRAAAPELWTPRASTVARLAAQSYARGQRDDLWQLVPLYLRRSAAEEKWDQRHGTGPG